MASNIRTDDVLGNLELRSNGYWCAEPTVAGHPVSIGIGLKDFSEASFITATALARRIVEALSDSNNSFRAAIAEELLPLYQQHYRLDDDPELDSVGFRALLQPKWIEMGPDAWQRWCVRIVYTAEELFDGRSVEIWVSPESLQVEMVNLT